MTRWPLLWHPAVMLEVPVIHDGDDFFVVNKPAGLAVQGGVGITRCLTDILESRMGEKVFLVHRLDRDTSGLLLVARSASSARFWTGLFAGGKGGALRKRYLAVCVGSFPADTGSITTPVEVHGVVRSAATSWRQLQEHDGFSLLELELGTGRMHQIRIHLQREGHPIPGDDKYGDFPLNKRLRKELGLKHLLLHAWKLDVRAPGRPALSLEAPIPEAFSLVMDCEGIGT